MQPFDETLIYFFPETSENEPGGLSSGRNLDIITKKPKTLETI